MGIILVCMVPQGCEHRDLCYEHPHTRVPLVVEFDWSSDVDASPNGMTVHFFRIGSRATSPYIFDFKGRDGGQIVLPAGVYAALCYNNDSDSHGFVGYDSHENFGLRLGDLQRLGNMSLSPARLPRAEGAENERMANAPDSIWVASLSEVVVDAPVPGTGNTTSKAVVRFEMQTVVHHYTFIIHNPINFTNSISISASVSGMAGTVHPGRSMTGDETVTHAFEMTSTSDGGLVGHLLTFGHCSGNPIGARDSDSDDGVHKLVVYATLSDGQNWYSTHDVTAQIHGSHVADCVVELDSLALPKPSLSGGGLQPSVGGWKEYHETVGM